MTKGGGGQNVQLCVTSFINVSLENHPVYGHLVWRGKLKTGLYRGAQKPNLFGNRFMAGTI